MDSRAEHRWWEKKFDETFPSGETVDNYHVPYPLHQNVRALLKDFIVRVEAAAEARVRGEMIRKLEASLVIWIADYAWKRANPDSRFKEPPSMVYEQVEKDLHEFLESLSPTQGSSNKLT